MDARRDTSDGGATVFIITMTYCEWARAKCMVWLLTAHIQLPHELHMRGSNDLRAHFRRHGGGWSEARIYSCFGRVDRHEEVEIE